MYLSVDMNSWCLSENQINTHLVDTHSQFIVKMWKELFKSLASYSVECVKCIVMGENTLEDHMLSFHPSDLFAKVGDLLVEEVYVPGIRIDQNENTESLDDANVME